MTETVATLVASVSDEELVTALGRMYYTGQAEQAASYLEVRDRLRKMVAKPTTMSVVIEGHEALDDEPVLVPHVYGQEMGDETKWGISFTPWAEWLNMDVRAEPRLELAPADKLANILYEMTFNGFEEDEIQEFADELKDRVAEIEEYPERLVPLDLPNTPEK